MRLFETKNEGKGIKQDIWLLVDQFFRIQMTLFIDAMTQNVTLSSETGSTTPSPSQAFFIVRMKTLQMYGHLFSSSCTRMHAVILKISAGKTSGLPYCPAISPTAVKRYSHTSSPASTSPSSSMIYSTLPPSSFSPSPAARNRFAIVTDVYAHRMTEDLRMGTVFTLFPCFAACSFSYFLPSSFGY